MEFTVNPHQNPYRNITPVTTKQVVSSGEYLPLTFMVAQELENSKPSNK